MARLPRTYEAQIVDRLPATVFVDGGISNSAGEFRYPVVQTAVPFDRVILSPNGTVDREGAIEFRAGRAGDEMFPLVTWCGPGVKEHGDGPFPPPVNIDILELEEPTTELAVLSRRLYGNENTRINRLGITLFDSRTLTNTATGVSLLDSPDYAAADLPVAFLSQYAAGTADDDSLCCPTSATMVLRYWGVNIEAEQFARLSYDRCHRIHGNWSLTAAVLSSFGMTAWVQKHSFPGELYSVVRSGRPVIVSLSFDPGELPGAPIEQSKGHLLVVRGFARDGKVLVNDPAGRSAAAGRLAYDQFAFARAWLGHGGMAIHAVPEEQVR